MRLVRAPVRLPVWGCVARVPASIRANTKGHSGRLVRLESLPTHHSWILGVPAESETRREGRTEGQREKRGGWTVIRLMTLRFILPTVVFFFQCDPDQDSWRQREEDGRDERRDGESKRTRP